jgi:hypothetical protein
LSTPDTFSSAADFTEGSEKSDNVCVSGWILEAWWWIA